MSRRPLEDLTDSNTTNDGIWDVDGDFLRFIQTNSTPENINGLHAFLSQILENFSSEESDQKVEEMLVECFCDGHYVDEHEYDVYHWDDAVSDLFYGISLASIESDAKRDYLQNQIRSDSLDILMEEINRLKSTGHRTHKEAFLELDLAAIAIEPELARDEEEVPPNERINAVAVSPLADTGSTQYR